MFGLKDKTKEIHAAIDSAPKRILTMMNNIIEQEEVDSIGKRLNEIGFTRTAEADRFRQNQETLRIAKEVRDNINYYAKNYPYLKFLIEDELERICEKYNLIYAPVKHYIKDVPEKNISDIENAQPLKEQDDEFGIYGKQSVINNFNINALQFMAKTVVVFDLASDIRTSNAYTAKNTLFICAPKSHFDLTGLKKSKSGFFQIFEPKDPIVFRYVRGGVQVLTKWGLDAKDEKLMIPVLN